MFQKLNNIGTRIRPEEEVSCLLNGVKKGNDKMNTGKIIIKTDRIGTEVDFEAAFLHLSNCLPEIRSTCRISYI